MKTERVKLAAKRPSEQVTRKSVITASETAADRRALDGADVGFLARNRRVASL